MKFMWCVFSCWYLFYFSFLQPSILCCSFNFSTTYFLFFCCVMYFFFPSFHWASLICFFTGFLLQSIFISLSSHILCLRPSQLSGICRMIVSAGLMIMNSSQDFCLSFLIICFTSVLDFLNR